ncbi:MAG: PKD domain-containing protein [Acidobacteriota bacterium]|nr:PKD domain-containing protein [Acidobacteriota bacterium]
MPTSIKTLAGILLLAGLAGCTNKVEIPALAGPSTLGYSIMLTSNTTSLIQDGVSSATIEITGRDANGQPITGRPLRAAIIVGGVVQDFGTLSTKSPVTGGTLRYTAPPASPIAGGQVPQTVTIAVTPLDSGDFLNEVTRGVDIQLVPQGVILPTNPALVAAFTVTPAAPQAFSTAAFDASTTTNNGTACLTACSYAWNFGDGTTGTGMTTTHEYRTVGAVQATLTVTDSRGAQSTTVRTVTVAASTPPTATFVMSPTPVGINQDVFFNAEQSRATLPRRIVTYGWNFGDGRTANGVSVARSFSTVGTYTIVLTVTDDAGAFSQATQSLSVTANAGMNAVLVFSPTATLTTATEINFDASGSTSANPIVEYKFNWGDGTSEELQPGPINRHRFSRAGTYVVRLTIKDSLGRTATTTVNVTIT